MVDNSSSLWNYSRKGY